MPAPTTTARADVIALRWHPTLSLPTRLRLVRKDYGSRTGRPKLTQAEFSAELGANPNTYKQWEAGHSRPADLIGFAKTVYKVTGCDPAWLLDVASDEAPTPGDGGSVIGESGSACTRSPQVTHLFGHRFDPVQPIDQCA
jgi:transcriptional regulator with XRE-family HTH domain